MKRWIQRGWLLGLLLLLSGCSGGTWTDDPDNWSRAFHESRPADGIEIVHSWYWRSAHWTAEFAWFFELRIEPSTQVAMLANPEVTPLPGFSAHDLRLRVWTSRPAWFLPQPLSAYAVYSMGPGEDFLIFVERGSNTVFWTANQL